MLFFASVINYVDRQALSVLAPVLTKELGISPIEYSYILQAFLISYTLMYLGSGVIADRVGTRIALAGFMTWWSIANACHAFARSALGLGWWRFLLGAGESGNFMASIKAVSEWYPPKEKAFVNGLINAGAAVGAIVATPLVVWINLHYGWRAAFVITGSLGLVWLIPWLWLYRRPEESPHLRAEELALIQSGAQASAARRIPWRELFAYRQTWGLMCARVISDPVWWFYLFWLPKYLVDERGFTMVEMGKLAWMPYLAADAGSALGGVMSGWLMKRGMAAIRSRLTIMAAAAMLMPLSVWVAYTESNALALGLICLVTFAHMAWKTCLMTLTNDVYPPAVIGSAAGVVAFGSGVGATLFTNLTGWMVEHFSYTGIFVVMGFLHPASWFVVKALVRKPIVGAEELLRK